MAEINKIKVGTTEYNVKDEAAIHNASIDPTTKVINIEGNTVTFTLSGTSLTVTFGSAS